MSNVIIISGAGSGFGALSARALALAGNTVYAGMRGINGRNASRAAEATRFAQEHGVQLLPLELDSSAQAFIDAGVRRVIHEQDKIDAIVHNVGHMVSGPTEAFTPEQLAEVYDVNVLSAQRLNRAALPYLRTRRQGLLLWVGSSSSRGGTPPYLGPYFAAKAAMDALAVSYAAEVARFGVETSIVVPGSFTSGTNHFATAGSPEDQGIVAEYEVLYPGVLAGVGEKLAALAPADADASWVADEIARIVALPAGQRPFRTHVDPANDGSEEVSMVADRIRAQFLARIGLEDLLEPAARQARSA
ncbi:SDR family NAD(P)-dependent oxidoreductase (plasmid) [Paenarthrobacter sp. OM7]|uniref:SDR family NAD(P)-dependent oxidoreductase n=1 Tax=Paenarthrobacter sp. OM7 TaxID=3041264 RepID=UPI002468C1E5|nr:SDR family NAD(P)-dependent oxidoreductase [Paenarthrobacter sp. OM7]WGM22914.1 SDR family NAD(P)-dependent oxidoreductase [Paenarthrobacter sp. OM7]